MIRSQKSHFTEKNEKYPQICGLKSKNSPKYEISIKKPVFPAFFQISNT